MMHDVPFWRLLVLRAYYLLMAVGTALVFWPDLLAHDSAFGVKWGAQYALLCGLTPFAVLGLFYPLKMLPIVLYEFTWKALWLALVAAPLWLGDAMTDGVKSNVFACSIAIVLTPFVTPWVFVWRTLRAKRASA